VSVPTGKVVSAINRRNWEGTGVTPLLEVAQADTLTFAHVSALQRLIPASDEGWRLHLEQALRDLDTGPPAR
jgi:hypothetical protein